MSLYEHQIIGADWLASRLPNVRGQVTGYLADQPGLGKTRTAIRAVRAAGAQCPLIVCPAIVRTHWHREGFVDAQEFGGEDFPVKSYDEIVRGGFPLMKQLIIDEKIDALVLDEVHYCKHAESQRTQLLLGANGYARRLPVVFALSGTPLRNPAEIWTILASLFPEIAKEHGLHSRGDLIQKFCKTRGFMIRGQWREKVLPEIRNAPEFKELLDKILLRRTLADVGIDVPALTWQTQWFDASPLYDDDVTAQVAAAALSGRLDEIARDPAVARVRRWIGEAKAPIAAEVIADTLDATEEKVVVFAYHRSVIAMLEDELRARGYESVVIHGDVSQTARTQIVDAFATDDRRVFIGQITAAGTGLDGLQRSGARRVFLVEPSWVQAENVQAAKRVARIGGAGPVLAQRLLLSGTIDSYVEAVNDKEERLQDYLLSGETAPRDQMQEVQKG